MGTLFYFFFIVWFKLDCASAFFFSLGTKGLHLLKLWKLGKPILPQVHTQYRKRFTGCVPIKVSFKNAQIKISIFSLTEMQQSIDFSCFFLQRKIPDCCTLLSLFLSLWWLSLFLVLLYYIIFCWNIAILPNAILANYEKQHTNYQ